MSRSSRGLYEERSLPEIPPMDEFHEAGRAALAEAEQRGDQREIDETKVVLAQTSAAFAKRPADQASNAAIASKKLVELVSGLGKHSANRHHASRFFILIATLPIGFTVALPEVHVRPAIAAVLAAIQQHSQLERLAYWGLYALRALIRSPLSAARDDSAKAKVLKLAKYACGELSATPRVVACMRQHVSNDTVQAVGATILSFSATSSRECAQVVVAVGGIEAAVAAMSTHSPSLAYLHKTCVGVFVAVLWDHIDATCAATRSRIVAAGAVPVVLRTMQLAADEVHVIDDCLTVLSELAHLSLIPVRRECLKHWGEMSAAKPWRPLVDVCRRHPGELPLVGKAIGVLVVVGGAVGGPEKAFRAGALEAAMAGVRRHPSEPAMAEFAARLLITLSGNNDRSEGNLSFDPKDVARRAEIRALGAVSFMAAAMDKHPANATIQEIGLMAIGNLAETSADPETWRVTSGAVLRAVGRPRAAGRIADIGFGILLRHFEVGIAPDVAASYAGCARATLRSSPLPSEAGRAAQHMLDRLMTEGFVAAAGAGTLPRAPSSAAASLLGECGGCGKQRGEVKLKLCTACGAAAYCSKECQRAAWRAHKPLCHQLSPPASRL